MTVSLAFAHRGTASSFSPQGRGGLQGEEGGKGEKSYLFGLSLLEQQHRPGLLLLRDRQWHRLPVGCLWCPVCPPAPPSTGSRAVLSMAKPPMGWGVILPFHPSVCPHTPPNTLLGMHLPWQRLLGTGAILAPSLS